MSINAVKEFMVHFHTYRNIDLINQGLYQIRARIYYTEKNIKYYAIPYFYVDSKGSENLPKNDENNVKPHKIISNHISENNWEYVTKTFLIRYYDEEVEIDEFCYFRLELPSNLINTKILYQLEFELFFSDALLGLESDRKSSTNIDKNYNNNNILNNVEFKTASCQISYINYDSECPGYIESFNPVVYSDTFFSILNTSIHMVILDYKIRVNNFSAYSTTGSGDGKDKIENFKNKNNQIKEEYKNSKNNLEINQQNNKNINSMIDFFVDDKDEKITNGIIKEELADKLYNTYVISMIKNYFFMRKKYERLMNKLIDDKIKSDFPFFIVRNFYIFP